VKLHLVLELQPTEKARGLLRAFLERLKRGPLPTARDLAALLLVAQPGLMSIRLAGTSAGLGRHRWVRTSVEVPWSAVPASLYTCARCGATKQSLPPHVAGGEWRTEYRVLTASGAFETVQKRPTCPGRNVESLPPPGMEKGGVNSPPTTQRPHFHPCGQGRPLSDVQSSSKEPKPK
jgi:hypothetical protein